MTSRISLVKPEIIEIGAWSDPGHMFIDAGGDRTSDVSNVAQGNSHGGLNHEASWSLLNGSTEGSFAFNDTFEPINNLSNANYSPHQTSDSPGLYSANRNPYPALTYSKERAYPAVGRHTKAPVSNAPSPYVSPAQTMVRRPDQQLQNHYIPNGNQGFPTMDTPLYPWQSVNPRADYLNFQGLPHPYSQPSSCPTSSCRHGSSVNSTESSNNHTQTSATTANSPAHYTHCHVSSDLLPENIFQQRITSDIYHRNEGTVDASSQHKYDFTRDTMITTPPKVNARPSTSPSTSKAKFRTSKRGGSVHLPSQHSLVSHVEDFEYVPPQSNGDGLLFADWNAALKHMKGPSRFPDEDPTFPSSDIEHRQYVAQIVLAMHDMSTAKDNENVLKQWHRVLTEPVGPVKLECAAWQILIRAKQCELQENPLAPTEGEQVFETFAQRMELICESLKTQKTICRATLTDRLIDRLVQCPGGTKQRTELNRRTNANKKSNQEKGERAERALESIKDRLDPSIKDALLAAESSAADTLVQQKSKKSTGGKCRKRKIEDDEEYAGNADLPTERTSRRTRRRIGKAMSRQAKRTPFESLSASPATREIPRDSRLSSSSLSAPLTLEDEGLQNLDPALLSTEYNLGHYRESIQSSNDSHHGSFQRKILEDLPVQPGSETDFF